MDTFDNKRTDMEGCADSRSRLRQSIFLNGTSVPKTTMNKSSIMLVIMALIFINTIPEGSMSSAATHDLHSLTYFPDTQWASTAPEEQGMSSTVLNDLISFINGSGSQIDGLVITRNGYIVTERYWGNYNENRSHHIFSCTKSFTSALVGIAIKEGFIANVSQRMLDFFPEITVENPSELKDSITIEHLLTMTHGLDWNEWNISYTDPTNMYNQMFYSSDPVKFFLDLPSIYPPGEHWVYTTGASHILSAIVQRATGMTSLQFAEQYLFEPMNATVALWSSANGVNIGGTLLYVTPRTMAKLGLLYLNNGTWNGREILTNEWVTASRTPYIEVWTNTSYGYQWWIEDDYEGYAALGSQMQEIYINPKLNIVVAMTGSVTDPAYDISGLIIGHLLRAVREYVPVSTIPGALTQPLIILGAVSVVVVVVAILARHLHKQSQR
jgi:CubicO group peptidase (beta-lactamase class C family)